MILAWSLAPGSALAQHVPGESATQADRETVAERFEGRGYSPYSGRHFPTKPLFGDTHLHTNLSPDAFGFGVRLGPEEAYRFARGEEVTSSGGEKVRLSRPLDFVVIADHAEAIGGSIAMYEGNPELMVDPTLKRWHEMLNVGGETAFQAVMELINAAGTNTVPPLLFSKNIFRSTWEKLNETTDRFNEPGVFTAFNGYEWSSHPNGDNLHRVVVFRDASSKTSRVLPFRSIIDSDDPRDLWKALAAYEERTGGSVLAIPHNGNLSNGWMFPESSTYFDAPVNREYAETRMRWEPLIEATQIKGDGETHPLLSPDDEFANYETWDKGNLDLSELKKDEMLKYEYARSALRLGLELEETIGVNPYKFGLSGATDSHTGLATPAEENFFGKHSGSEPSPERAKKASFDFSGVTIMGWQEAASGLTAVWSTENTREGIFDAMMRKETYATTGSRLTVRFFGGWDFVAADANTRELGQVGYDKGVPMGGDLSSAPSGKAPTFLVAALKDPYNGNLDRIQIIKGWLDDKGIAQERVYDVAVSDGRTIGVDGRSRTPVGNTVDVGNATWSNTIGDPELVAVWEDPDFDASQKAFYYARVIEIPTPRWTAYDAKRFGIEMADEVPMWTQERAYTSPIWYTP
jgi:hypothetical protein